MASIIKYKNGYRVFVTVAGKRKTKTFATKRDATEWRAHMEAEMLRDKDKPEAERHTVADLFKRYVRDVSSTKQGEQQEALRFAAFIRDFPNLASMSLSEFKTPQLVEWRDARLKKVAPASVVRDINLIRNAFITARKEWHWINHHPFDGLKIPLEGPPRDRRVDPWKEVRPIVRVLGYVTGQAPVTKSQEVALAFLVALRTAMRAGEILQLGKGTLDIQTRVARVAHKTQYLTMKPRPIPLTRHAVRLLAPVANADKCFTVDSDSLAALFIKAKKRLRIKGLQFRDSRAEALTRLARKVDVLTLSKISGHKDLEMLSRVYYRETAEDIAARL
ncbi:integrase [Paraburkholderia acidicola]|uniref:Integrase n=1 Tax=Paraburkholderia acidicola TaxID=1912599 RepID=A0A2A4F0Z9_9BURK|nr:tyrosine-type recombinase/integrase [Paraburkholderia acidicola]PCE27533.1 integrase [Paraburkholderia acidicola]